MITKQMFDTKCNEIAAILGGTFNGERCLASWIYVGDFTLPNGTSFAVRCEAREGDPAPKMEVRGNWPRSEAKNEVFYPSEYSKTNYAPINVTITRSAKAIAGEISRRFLPRYEAELLIQTQRRDSSDGHANLTEKNVAHLAKVSGGKRYDSHKNEISLHGVRSDIYGSAKVFGDSINIELNSLTPAQAEAVLKLFRTL